MVTLHKLGHYVQRLNSGAIPRVGKNGKTYVVRGAEPGTPDILSIYRGHAYFWEVKRPGKKPTFLQEAKMKQLREYGARCSVVTGIDDVMKSLKLFSANEQVFG